MGYIYFILFLSFILLNLKISSKISTNNFSEIIITGFLIYSTSLSISGYILSFIGLWYSPILWGVLPFFIALIIYQFFKNFEFIENHKSTFKLLGGNIQKISDEVKESSFFHKRFFQILFFFVFSVFLCLLTSYFVNPPNEWDSMTGHLNRILYFIQNGNTKHFIGTNWNIDTYPKSFPNQQVYPFLLHEKSEIWFKFQNFSSYIITGFAFYGICKRLGYTFKTRLIVSCIYLLIPISLIQSTTTDSDIVLACYLSILVYYLISYFDQFEKRYILLGSIVFSIALAHKITFVFSFPPLFILYSYFIYKKRSERPLRHFKYIFFTNFISLLIIVAPCGYISNMVNYGHPIGPKTATQHQSIERAGDLGNLLKQGSRNTIRYTSDLFNLDGLRNIPAFEKINNLFQVPFKFLDQYFYLGLVSETNFTILPFEFGRRDLFANGTPIVGIISIIFLLSIFLLIFSKKINNRGVLSILFFAFILHFLALSFTAAYDPWKGRYMQSSFIYLLPITGVLFEKMLLTKNRIFQYSSLGFIFLVGLSAFFTISLHRRALLFDYYGQKSIFNLNRIEALTISRPDITKSYLNFEKIVPKNAKVALGTLNDDYEYPLWGNEFTRKLTPINPFEKGIQAIPEGTDYLFFSSEVIKPQKGDILLDTKKVNCDSLLTVKAGNYYLRKLK